MTIKISLDEYKDLLACKHELLALQSGGVDNWTWEGESRRDYINDYINDDKYFRKYLQIQDGQFIEDVDFETIAEYEAQMRLELQEEENAST